MTIEPNLNTIIDGLILAIVVGAYKHLREMNGSVKKLVQWKTDHTLEHEKDWRIQRTMCDIRHGGRRSYDPILLPTIPESGPEEAT
jgi:hypothetical protein